MGVQRAVNIGLAAEAADCTFAATGNEVFVVSSEAGVDGVEALGHTLVFPHQHPVLEVPQVNSLQNVSRATAYKVLNIRQFFSNQRAL